MLKLAIGAGVIAHPRAVDGVRGALEQLHRIFGQSAILVLDHLLVGVSETLECFAVEHRLGSEAFGGDQFVEPLRKPRPVHAENDGAVAFEKPASAVPGKARMAAHAHETVYRSRRTADIEHTIQHSWHRSCGTRTHRHQERAAAVAEELAGRLLEKGNAFVQTIGQFLLRPRFVADARGAELDRKNERRWHGETESGHMRQIGRLRSNGFGRVEFGRSVLRYG